MGKFAALVWEGGVHLGHLLLHPLDPVCHGVKPVPLQASPVPNQERFVWGVRKG